MLVLIFQTIIWENVESHGKKMVNNDDNLLQIKRIRVGFVPESEIKRLLQTKQVIISLFKMRYLLLQYNIGFNLPFYLH